MSALTLEGLRNETEKNLKSKPKRAQTSVHVKRPTRIDKTGQKGR